MMPNTSHKRIAQRTWDGQRISVYAAGFFWKNPKEGVLEHLGRTQSEARAELDRLLALQKTNPQGRRRVTARADIAKVAPPDMHRAYWRAYYYASARAKRAGQLLMGRTEFENMIRRAGGRCELTGISFSLERAAKGRKALWAPSIDRKACGRGYDYNNCQLVCIAVNIALNEFGRDVLLRIATALLDKNATSTSATSTAYSGVANTHNEGKA